MTVVIPSASVNGSKQREWRERGQPTHYPIILTTAAATSLRNSGAETAPTLQGGGGWAMLRHFSSRCSARLPFLAAAFFSNDLSFLSPSAISSIPSSPLIRLSTPLCPPADGQGSPLLLRRGLAGDIGGGSSAARLMESLADGRDQAMESSAAVAGSSQEVQLKLEELNWDHSFVRELPGDPRTDTIPREVLLVWFYLVFRI